MGEYVTKILKCFGCIEGDEPIGFPSANQSGAVNKDEVVAPYLQVMARFRADIRNGMKGDKSDLAKVVSFFSLYISRRFSSGRPTYRAKHIFTSKGSD